CSCPSDRRRGALGPPPSFDFAQDEGSSVPTLPQPSPLHPERSRRMKPAPVSARPLGAAPRLPQQRGEGFQRGYSALSDASPGCLQLRFNRIVRRGGETVDVSLADDLVQGLETLLP